MLRYFEKEEVGNNILTLLNENEISPNEIYYIVDSVKSNLFYETSFSHEVSWETILEFVQTNKIYKKNGNKREECKTEGAHIRVTNQRLF